MSELKFKEGDDVYNGRLKKSGVIVNVHPDQGRTSSELKSQNAYSVLVAGGLIEVWMEDTDFLTLKEE